MNEIPEKYLSAGEFIDCGHPSVAAKAAELAGHSEVETARRCEEVLLALPDVA